MAPMEVISLFLVKTKPLPVTLWLPTHPPTFPPYRSASGIGYASKQPSKMVGNLASYPVYSRYNELL